MIFGDLYGIKPIEFVLMPLFLKYLQIIIRFSELRFKKQKISYTYINILNYLYWFKPWQYNFYFIQNLFYCNGKWLNRYFSNVIVVIYLFLFSNYTFINYAMFCIKIYLNKSLLLKMHWIIKENLYLQKNN